MTFKQFDIWLADLNPTLGTEPGKVRPVVIIQTDLLNNEHPSTLICPVTTQLTSGVEILRIKLNKQQLKKPSEILVDQIRSIDNRRFIKPLGKLTKSQVSKIKDNLVILLDLNPIYP
jgi:mRNA interferase MazF